MDQNDLQTSLAHIEDSWGLAQFQDEDGDIRLIRFNAGFIPWRGKQSYPLRMGIAIPTEDGDFGEEVEEALAKAEAKLFEVCKASGKAVVTLFITEPHYKEALLYIQEEPVGEAIMDDLAALNLGFEFQYYYEEDADWQVYWLVADDLDLLPKMPGEESKEKPASQS